MSEVLELFGEWGQAHDGRPLKLTVRTFRGQGGAGRVYGDPVEHEGWPQVSQDRAVLNSDGDEVRSTSALLVPLGHADEFTLESMVTLDGAEREVLVLSVSRADHFGLFDGVVVNLE